MTKTLQKDPKPFQNAFFEPLKTVPIQTFPEFHHRKDQSTILSILVEKLAAAKGPYLGLKVGPIS